MKKDKKIVTGGTTNTGVCKPIGKEWVDKIKNSILIKNKRKNNEKV